MGCNSADSSHDLTAQHGQPILPRLFALLCFFTAVFLPNPGSRKGFRLYAACHLSRTVQPAI